jgi:ubiquitin C-terminal hydrolase
MADRIDNPGMVIDDSDTIEDLDQYYYSDCGYNDGLIRVKGMRNLGNTCYMNAAIQALLSSNIMNSRIIRYTQQNPGKITELSPMLFEYVKLVYQLIDSGSKDESHASIEARQKMRAMREQSMIVPRDFKDVLSKENPRFAGYRQEDSQELIEFLLSDFTELPRNLRPEDQRDSKASPTEFTSIRKILRDSYFGTYRQVIKCKDCGSKRNDIFNHSDIIIPVPRELIERNRRLPRHAKRTITIADCFGKYCETEVLDGDNKVTCEECGIKTKSTKRMELDYVPELTVVTINRFKAQLTKIQEPIKVFSKIELDGYPLRLIATVNHSGSSIHGGHYTSYVSRSKYDNYGKLQEEWFMADDSSIRPVNKKDILSDTRIYLALYERVQTFDNE